MAVGYVTNSNTRLSTRCDCLLRQEFQIAFTEAGIYPFALFISRRNSM